ncbi:hypothetical protein [Streptomyces sp. LaBMicrA B280]|uniref:hypothetical protein n=1 Tax=Streptomyces sp. LaBMicrA B280 TaxID=3391001 RepID=UPI003BA6FCB3
MELLLKFMDTAMKKDDSVETLARIEALNAVTYEDYQSMLRGGVQQVRGQRRARHGPRCVRGH